jgi:hypothetical protein
MCKILVAFGLLALSGCAPATASVPRPSVTPSAKETIVGSVHVDVDDLPEGPVCSYVEGGDELCVTGLRSAYEQGVKQVIEAFIRPGAGPRYRALFRIIEFSQIPHNVNVLGRDQSTLLEMTWQFSLSDNRGNKIVYVERTTPSPKLLRDPSQLEQVAGELVVSSLNQLNDALNEAGVHVPNAQRVFTAPPPEGRP